MSKFKVGDKVQRLPKYQNVNNWQVQDSVITVEKLDEDGDLIFEHDQDKEYGWVAERFELVEPAEQWPTKQDMEDVILQYADGRNISVATFQQMAAAIRKRRFKTKEELLDDFSNAYDVSTEALESLIEAVNGVES